MGKGTWLAATIVLLLVHVALIIALPHYFPAHEPQLLSGFSGNLVSGLLGGLLFLFFGLFQNDRLEKLQAETHRLTLERDARDEAHRKHDRFIAFLREEGWHDICLPNLATERQSLGLHYTIEPVRDESGEPRCRVSEMITEYVVRVRGPAHEAVLPPEVLQEYQDAPIHSGEYYFCRFFNGQWHMGQEAFGENHPFYLSGKVGPVEYGTTANSLVGASEAPSTAKRLCRFAVDENGELMRGSGGATPVEILQEENGGLLLHIYGAPPKRLRIKSGGAGVSDIRIDNFEGYFPGPALRDPLI